MILLRWLCSCAFLACLALACVFMGACAYACARSVPSKPGNVQRAPQETGTLTQTVIVRVVVRTELAPEDSPTCAPAPACVRGPRAWRD
jgi:hypothetical protein